SLVCPPQIYTLLPYTTLFRSKKFLNTLNERQLDDFFLGELTEANSVFHLTFTGGSTSQPIIALLSKQYDVKPNIIHADVLKLKKDRKSTRLNSSHVSISYAVF